MRLQLYRARTEGDHASLAGGIEFANGLFDRLTQGGYLPIALETLLLRAQLQAASGDTQASLADMTRALELGEPEGIISIFVEEAQPVVDGLALLIDRRRLSPGLAGYVRMILAASPNAYLHLKSPLEPAAMVESLTERELDVLRLIAEGLKYEEIAGKLFISLNTVRTYVKGIYGKLDVNSRSQAVLIARQNQIL